MANIWGRAYRLEVGDRGELLRVDGTTGSPANIRFNVTVHADAMTTLAEITVYGLNRESRDRFYQQYTRVKLEAGYVDNIAVIFEGTIYNTAIGRQGAETFTTMYCRSIGSEWESSFVNKTWGANTPAKQYIEEVAETFGYPVEFVGDFSDLPALINGATLSQSTKSAMNDLGRNYSFSWTMRNFRLTITRLGAAKETENSMYRIAADTGMVGSPQIRERGVDVTIKMNPDIAPYDRILLQNATAELTFNNPASVRYPATIGEGEYVIRSMSHIGEFEGEQWDTLLEGWNWRLNGELPRTGF